MLRFHNLSEIKARLLKYFVMFRFVSLFYVFSLYLVGELTKFKLIKCQHLEVNKKEKEVRRFIKGWEKVRERNNRKRNKWLLLSQSSLFKQV